MFQRNYPLWLCEATSVTGRCASRGYLGYLSRLFRRDIAYSTKRSIHTQEPFKHPANWEFLINVLLQKGR